MGLVLFFLLQNSSCQNSAFPSPLTLPRALEITHLFHSPSLISSSLPSAKKKKGRMTVRRGRWGIQTFSRSGLVVSGCVATSKHFFHSCLSSARQLGPLAVNLPARCEGQTQAIFPPSRCQAAAKTLEKHFQRTSLCSLSSAHNPSAVNVSGDQTWANYPSPLDRLRFFHNALSD